MLAFLSLTQVKLKGSHTLIHVVVRSLLKQMSKFILTSVLSAELCAHWMPLVNKVHKAEHPSTQLSRDPIDSMLAT